MWKRSAGASSRRAPSRRSAGIPLVTVELLSWSNSADFPGPEAQDHLSRSQRGGNIHGHFLEHADRVLPPEMKFDLVLLAPACSFAFFAERLASIRRRVANVRIFGLSDERERSYWEVPLVFRGSLLYIVAGLFEEEVDLALLGMRRYHNLEVFVGREGVSAVLDFLAGKPAVWAVADDGPGLTSGARKHGSFSSDPRTLESIRHLIANGF